MDKKRKTSKHLGSASVRSRICSTTISTFFFLVGWVGAVPHPLPGVPLTFLSVISYGDPWKIIINFSNANANANTNADANAKVTGFWSFTPFYVYPRLRFSENSMNHQ